MMNMHCKIFSRSLKLYYTECYYVVLYTEGPIDLHSEPKTDTYIKIVNIIPPIYSWCLLEVSRLLTSDTRFSVQLMYCSY